MDAPSWLGLARVLRPLDCIQQLACRYPSTLGQLVKTTRSGMVVDCDTQ